MALNLFRRLMPPEISFTSQFCDQATCIVEAALELRDMVDHQTISTDKHVTSIRAIEKRPMVRMTSCSSDATAPSENCHSNRNQM